MFENGENETIFCPKCGHKMLDKSVGGAVEVICPHCGNGWVAYEDQKKNALYSDDNSYQLFVDLIKPTPLDLKALAEIVGSTALNVKKSLDRGEFLAADKAYVLKPLLAKLRNAGYAFHTIPEYNHKISDDE